MKILAFALSVLSFSTLAQSAFAQAVPVQSQQLEPLETWQGIIELPNNVKLNFVIKVFELNKATISVPLQGISDSALNTFSESDKEISFSWDLAKATVIFKREGDRATGIWQQGGGTSNVSLQKLENTKVLETWRGVIQLPGQQLEFFIKVLSQNKATINISAQGVTDVPLTEFSKTDKEIRFVWNIPGQATWILQRNGDKASGTFTQNGATFNTTLEKLPAGAELPKLNRPQTPQPPFPYQSVEVSYINPNDGTKLAGTLTIPNSAGPHPVVVLITGSGAEDRDETILGHKPFLVIADYLTRQGIAVLRSDDRGVGGSTSPKNGQETTLDFVGDVVAAVNFLKTRPEIDQKHIGLIGHSEGGLIAPIVATKSSDVAFIISLAGTGVSGNEIILRQFTDISRVQGVDEITINRFIGSQKDLFQAIKTDKSDEFIKNIIKEQIKFESNQAGTNLTDEQINIGVEEAFNSIKSPWFKTFLTLDPREYLRKVKIPVLALNGSLDLQVAADQNLPEILKSLQEADNHDITVIELPGLNHLFQSAKTGSPNEYSQIEQTFSPKVLEIITFWIKQRV